MYLYVCTRAHSIYPFPDGDCGTFKKKKKVYYVVHIILTFTLAAQNEKMSKIQIK